MIEIGERVGAILKSDKEKVWLFGFGTYEGDHVPEKGWLCELCCKNPKIKLDDGRIVWGYQCWWGREETVKRSFDGKKIMLADIAEDEE